MSETPDAPKAQEGWEPPAHASGGDAWQPPRTESPFAQRGPDTPPPTRWQEPAHSQFVHPGGQPPGGVTQSGSSGKATASLVLGICGLAFFPLLCSVLALVFGYQSRKEIDQSGGRLAGRGNATAGIVLGWVGLVVWMLVIAGIVALAATGNFEESYLDSGAGEI